MKVIYTYEALRDLDEILTFIASNYPNISAAFQERLQSVERRIGMWPMSAEEVTQRPGVRVVPLVRYPYKIFYQITNEAVEITLHPPCSPPGAEWGAALSERRVGRA